jgi:hypothetical protein
MGEPADRPAFYALSPGGWRDYWSLLHPPYTAWHLSYVVIGACVAPVLDVGWLVETLLAFFLAMGLAAHALDELNGRPLRTRIPDGVLWAIAIVGLAGAIGLGIHGTIVISPWLWAFIGVGGFLVVAYNLELFGGAFHSDVWFALGWGAFPALTAYFAQTGTIRVEAVLVAAGCAAISAAQRVLSTPVRRLRRTVASVSGELVTTEGAHEPLDASSLRSAPEGALRWLSRPSRCSPSDCSSPRSDARVSFVTDRRGASWGSTGRDDRPDHVSVTDVDRSVAFYRDVLGIPFLFGVPGQPMAFFDCDGRSPLPGRARIRGVSGPGMLYFTVDDIQEAHRALTRTRRLVPAIHRTSCTAPRDPSCTWRSSAIRTATTWR